MTIHWLIKEQGLYRFQLLVKSSESHSFEFELRSIQSWEIDDENTPIIDDSEVHAAGWVKWDGCSNIIFDGGGYAHFCGVDDMRRHGLAMIEVYRLAHEYFMGFSDSWYAQQNPDSFILEAANASS